MQPHFRISGLLAALSLLGPALAGCSSPGSDASQPSPFAGTWRGSFSDQRSGQQGTLNLTIDSQGNVTGQVTSGANQMGTVTGALNNGGAITLSYSGGSQMGGAMVQMAANGHLVTYVPTAPGGGPPLLSPGVTTLTLDLTRQ
jgi:hypothetical protein